MRWQRMVTKIFMDPELKLLIKSSWEKSHSSDQKMGFMDTGKADLKENEKNMEGIKFPLMFKSKIPIISQQEIIATG